MNSTVFMANVRGADFDRFVEAANSVGRALDWREGYYARAEVLGLVHGTEACEEFQEAIQAAAHSLGMTGVRVTSFPENF